MPSPQLQRVSQAHRESCSHASELSHRQAHPTAFALCSWLTICRRGSLRHLQAEQTEQTLPCDVEESRAIFKTSKASCQKARHLDQDLTWFFDTFFGLGFLKSNKKEVSLSKWLVITLHLDNLPGTSPAWRQRVNRSDEGKFQQ